MPISFTHSRTHNERESVNVYIWQLIWSDSVRLNDARSLTKHIAQYFRWHYSPLHKYTSASNINSLIRCKNAKISLLLERILLQHFLLEISCDLDFSSLPHWQFWKKMWKTKASYVSQLDGLVDKRTKLYLVYFGYEPMRNRKIVSHEAIQL